MSLFSNLAPDAKPIATKSRRYSQEDRNFIQENVDKLLSLEVIRPSSSPCRAQEVVVKDEFNRHKKRLCVDYSLTINIYTELDAYPLPRMGEMINELAKYSVFSTFDLCSAYHQSKIVEPERKYTAFEANGKLFEFNRIPFGCKKWSCCVSKNNFSISRKRKSKRCLSLFRQRYSRRKKLGRT